MESSSSSAMMNQYAIESNLSLPDPKHISPLQALVDRRFSNLLVRAEANQKTIRHSQVNPVSPIHSSNSIDIGSNVESAKSLTEKNTTVSPKKKECLTPVWKNRLQGLAVGLVVAAILTAVALAVSLTRPWEKVTTSATTTTTTAGTACNSLQWNPVGIVVAGNGTSGTAANQLSNPRAVYVDSDNVIYVADYSNSRLQKWLPNAINGATVFGTTGVCILGGTGLCYPRVIYGDGQQNLYIGDSSGIRLWPIGASVSTLVNGSSGLITYGLFIDNNKNLYASTSGNQSIMMWNSAAPTGMIVAGGYGWGYSSSHLNNPYGLTVDSSTNTMYIANSQTHTIIAWQVGATSGTTFVGRNSTYGASTNLLRNPRDVKRDASGNLYVLDTDNSRILLVCSGSSNTAPRSIVDSGLGYPFNIALDASLNIYVADSNNHRILKYNRVT